MKKLTVVIGHGTKPGIGRTQYLRNIVLSHVQHKNLNPEYASLFNMPEPAKEKKEVVFATNGIDNGAFYFLDNFSVKTSTEQLTKNFDKLFFNYEQLNMTKEDHIQRMINIINSYHYQSLLTKDKKIEGLHLDFEKFVDFSINKTNFVGLCIKLKKFKPAILSSMKSSEKKLLHIFSGAILAFMEKNNYKYYSGIYEKDSLIVIDDFDVLLNEKTWIPFLSFMMEFFKHSEFVISTTNESLIDMIRTEEKMYNWQVQYINVNSEKGE